ncbi:hypothetical protein SAICODRAFT_25745 [Saitoella complicata NRRL Y-17804]|uniref:uncharacterized protein n=1 Tax=Saitoella complicata (strain BCRC 22490 / CBS 7301 / JCM 7358 / NBRC 10748 / NRRL Y-17804) TaxID=698492 RepID=UPI000867F5EC|nr:uncharacterized protein SAICODRAFT_25745 [Saitoella complicata NRRL Y-17804]ODQ52833.1 hypothetical protein SAICODRAFT_25745 [Saitoella complicata NRRL Y-17804]
MSALPPSPSLLRDGLKSDAEPFLNEVEDSRVPLTTTRSLHAVPYKGTVLKLFSFVVAAFVLVFGQHLFYLHLQGKIVDEHRLSQAWIGRITQGFGFLFKTLLVTAIGIAFDQVLSKVLSHTIIMVQNIPETKKRQCFTCVLHNATYDLNVNYVNNIPQVNIETVVHEPLSSTLVDDKLQDALNASLGYPETTTMVSGQTFNVEPYMDEESWSLLNFVAIKDAFVQYLRGTVTSGQGTVPPVADSGLLVLSTSLVTGLNGSAENQVTFLPNLAGSFEELFRNVTVNLLSSKSPAVRTFTRNATVTVVHNIYYYSDHERFIFWVSSGAGLGVAVLCIFIGSFCLLRNSFAGERSFSYVLISTRNPSLDGLCEGSILGAKDNQLNKQNLVFGPLRATGNAPVSDELRFGLPGGAGSQTSGSAPVR